MKVVLVLALVALAVATALAYGNGTVTSTMTAIAGAVLLGGNASEPAALLLSGSCLLGLAGAVKRVME